MPREKKTPKKNSMKAAEHSAKERRKTSGNRHQIFYMSDKPNAVKDAQIGDTITFQTDNQEGVKTWRVKREQNSNGKFVKIAKTIHTYDDSDYDDSDKTASEESAGNSSRGGKSRRRKSRKSRKTRKSFYNWS